MTSLLLRYLLFPGESNVPGSLIRRWSLSIFSSMIRRSIARLK